MANKTGSSIDTYYCDSAKEKAKAKAKADSAKAKEDVSIACNY